LIIDLVCFILYWPFFIDNWSTSNSWQTFGDKW